MIYLREIDRSDVPVIHSWRSDRSVVDTLTGAFRHVNITADEQWFDRYMASRSNQVRLAIVLRESHQMIGVAYLLGIDWVHRSAEFGLMIGAPEQWGKGYGTTATRLAVDHAFDDLNLNRVQLEVLEDNAGAIKVYERCGFVREGVLRDAVYKRGEYRSLVVMGLLASERGGERS